LEVLRHCLPASVKRTLKDLPESLDETYKCILKEIKKPNRGLAQRVLQCLAVATRPLRVAELAEVLAVDLDDSEGIPRLNPDWRWEDQEQALLIACSSLIAIVDAGDVKDSDSDSDAEANDGVSEVEVDDNDHDIEAGHSHLEAETNDGDSHTRASSSDFTSDGDLDVEAGHNDPEAETDDADSHVEAGDSRIVQFSHFSVKEFLTSSRLATASEEVSAYRIDLENAHTILAQACLAVLLQTHDGIDENTSKDHPLAKYAAEHWTTHAQFREVSSRLQNGMKYLFDSDKPHFKAWLILYDIDDIRPLVDPFQFFTRFFRYPPAPLYYAALCGFHDLVEHLIAKYPRDVNATGGYYMRPLIAALAGEYFETADLLRHNGADPHVQGYRETFPLHSAAFFEKFEVIQKLIEYEADIDARDMDGWTPLYWASRGRHLKDGSVLRLLLERGADVNALTRVGSTPLHRASQNGAVEVVRLLLEHGADVEAVDGDGKTALQIVGESIYDKVDQGRCDGVTKLLVDHGTK
jgi:hypothetical protein